MEIIPLKRLACPRVCGGDPRRGKTMNEKLYLSPRMRG